MRKTLYLKFILGYFIFGFFSFIFITFFVSDVTSKHLIRNESQRLYSAAANISDSYASKLYSNESSLEEVKEQLDVLSVYLKSTIQLINPSGRVVLDSSQPINVEKAVIVKNFDSTFTGDSYYATGTFFDTFDEEVLTVITPITSNYKVKGYVTIHLPLSAIEESNNQLLYIFYIMFVFIFFLSLIILIFFTEFVYTPLRKITYATEQYATGNMHYEFTVDSDDEIGYLAACLSYMASEIARSEDDQKKFVANVSHDFRSPLTSIRGFLEAMIDGTIPPELHNKYMGIVLNETERLTKLTNDMLTLNNLNTKGMLLDKVHFDVNEVIRNTAASFEATCRRKNIKFELVLTGEKLYAYADINKIQQVFYNLIDNAIKFSNANSVIKVETSEKRKRILVSIKDSGIGIPKEDLKMIWERFYKSDLSRGKDKKGTGLGLSIVKEIISAHNENINCISTPGEGTEFIFTLARSEMNDKEE